MKRTFFTSESVMEGHPDKLCDQIADGILDAILEQDPFARMACDDFRQYWFDYGFRPDYDGQHGGHSGHRAIHHSGCRLHGQRLWHRREGLFGSDRFGQAIS